ncbi:hypothetical protein HanRHA438_Chr17g0810221 [Helianthus annuus]|nr:hypothetical protein HanRHA438_Chr17g0810221 [Helianthus annuus]
MDELRDPEVEEEYHIRMNTSVSSLLTPSHKVTKAVNIRKKVQSKKQISKT